jgi:hypothetical protein
MEIEYKIATSATANELSSKVNDLIKDGWKPVDSHKVSIKLFCWCFSGNRHMDTINEFEFTQTLTRINNKF